MKLDCHCHILPGIDDGAKNLEEAVFLASWLVKHGYQRAICTSHCSFLYHNTPKTVSDACNLLREELDRRLIFLLHRETPTQAVFTYFVPDRKKEGGAYVRAAAVLLRYDACRQCLLLSGGLTVPTAHLAWIACDAFDTWEKSEDSGTI